MSDQNQHIKDLFSEKLGGFEAPVDASVWSSIESSISSSASSAGGAAASSSMSVGAKIAIVVAALSAITAAVVVVTQEDSTPEEIVATPIIDDVQEDNQDDIVQERVELPKETASYEEIVQPVSEEKKEKTVDAVVSNEPADIYHSELIQSYPIGRGAPPTVNTVQEEPHVEEDEVVMATPSESNGEVEEIVVSAEFTVWRDPSNPMRFTFTPLVGAADEYEWLIDQSPVSNAAHLNYEFTDAGSHQVTLLTRIGSTNSQPHEADIEAYEKPKVVVPNVISPNRDGRNDVLDLEALSINVSIQSVMVYDGAGELVFEGSDDNLKWNGMDRFGEPCAEGNYVCIYQAVGIDQKPYVGREIVRIER